MRTIPILVSCGLLTGGCLFAQDSEYHRNNISAALGAAVPTGNDTSYLSPAPLVSFHYGYRFLRFLQADAGFQLAFGAADNQNPEITDVGTVRGGDHEFMIPLGGRVILPLPFQRFEVSAGGGTMYLHYSETVPQNPYYQTGCYSCTSRGGWGEYGLANVSYFLDENHSFHVGTTVQYVTGTTNGEPVGNVPGNQTTDHWLNVSVEFGLSF